MKRTAKQAPARAVEIDLPLSMVRMNQMHGTHTRAYRMGECTVFAGIEPIDFRTSFVVVRPTARRWHLSIAHPRRYPTWDELAEAREQLLPNDLAFALMFPASWDEYVNTHPNCFHLWEVHDRES